LESEDGMDYGPLSSRNMTPPWMSLPNTWAQMMECYALVDEVIEREQLRALSPHDVIPWCSSSTWAKLGEN
jgi:hypothetical protein